jgi:endogenous inhibitor of DNA gyrase (YacG/DUF329 family)
MVIKCPRCGNETSFEGNPFRPFCSERCKLIDLGKWVTGAYRVPTKVQEEEEDGAPPPEKDPATE